MRAASPSSESSRSRAGGVGPGVVGRHHQAAAGRAHQRGHPAEVARHHRAPGGHRLHELGGHRAIVVAVALQRDPRHARRGQQARAPREWSTGPTLSAPGGRSPGSPGPAEHQPRAGHVHHGERRAHHLEAPQRAQPADVEGDRVAGRGGRLGKAPDQGELVTATARAPAAAKRAARSSLAATTAARRRAAARSARSAARATGTRAAGRGASAWCGPSRPGTRGRRRPPAGRCGARASTAAASSSGSWTW